MQNAIRSDAAGLADLKVAGSQRTASDVPSKKRDLRAIGPAGNNASSAWPKRDAHSITEAQSAGFDRTKNL
jgi:hypothetical protein